MGLTFAPGLPPLILSLRIPSTRNLGACYTVLQGFHHWCSPGLLEVGFAGVKGASTRAKGASKWASSLFTTSWCRGSISFLLLLPELSVLEIVWCKWIPFHFCHFILCV
jgi:hypothetical protein